MIRGFFYKFNRSFKNLKNVIFHVKLLSPTLIKEFEVQNFEPVLSNKHKLACLTLVVRDEIKVK